MLTFVELKAQILPSLQEIGLRDQEIDLYVHACLLGPSTVAMLSQQLGMSAPNVYKLIARLEEVGLAVFSTQKGYHRKLRVESPTKIVELLQRRRGQVDRLVDGLRTQMSDLVSSFHQGDAPPVFRVLQGQVQFQKATQLLFDDAEKELLLVGSLDAFIEAVSEDIYKRLAHERIERGIKLRALLTQTPFAQRLQKTSIQELREVRFLPDAATVASMQLTRRKAILWQPKAPLAIAVEDEHLVWLWRSLFEGIWSGAK